MPAPVSRFRTYAREFEAETQILAELDVGTQWNRMLNEFLNEYARLQRTTTGAEIDKAMQAFMDGLSERPMEDLARKSSSVAYNEGRDVEIKTAAAVGEAEVAVRTAVLDGNTCESCQSLDGMIVEIGSAEYDEYMPPAKCDGGDRCRCFYVPVAREAAA